MQKIKTLYGEKKPVYYVWGEGQGQPTKPHHSRFRAHKEAERLAQAHPGVNFHVLKLKETLAGERPELRIGDKVLYTRKDSPFADRVGTVEELKDLVVSIRYPTSLFIVPREDVELVERYQPPMPYRAFAAGDLVHIITGDDPTLYEVISNENDTICLARHSDGALVKGIFMPEQLRHAADESVPAGERLIDKVIA